MTGINHLLENNQQWADKIKKDDPDFFSNLAVQQKPKYLWIGCSDSRVPANDLLGLMPGEVFVHRNIANQVIHTDLNCLSVIQFAVEVLKVEHIIICGHSRCGGIQAALGDASHGLVDNWLRHIKDVYRFHKQKFDDVTDQCQREDLLCKLNVIEQVANLTNSTIVRDAWKREQPITVHGMVYDVRDGILNDLEVSVSGES